MAGLKFSSTSGLGQRFRLPAHPGARIVWEARRCLRQTGWGVVVGVLCSLLAFLLLWQTHQMGQRQQDLRKKISTAESTSAPKPAKDASPDDLAQQLAAFYAYLPDHADIPDQLKSLISIADKSGVTLAQAEYKPQLEVGADFLRYQIVLPVKADYASTQMFILKALKALPTLTLESVVFKRERIESAEVDARIQFMLLVKKPNPKGIER